MREFIGNPFQQEFEGDEDLDELDPVDEDIVATTLDLNADYMDTDLDDEEPNNGPGSVDSDPEYDPDLDSMSYYSDQASWVGALSFSSDDDDDADDDDHPIEGDFTPREEDASNLADHDRDPPMPEQS